MQMIKKGRKKMKREKEKSKSKFLYEAKTIAEKIEQILFFERVLNRDLSEDQKLILKLMNEYLQNRNSIWREEKTEEKLQNELALIKHNKKRLINRNKAIEELINCYLASKKTSLDRMHKELKELYEQA
jgi:hypothetical protein